MKKLVKAMASLVIATGMICSSNPLPQYYAIPSFAESDTEVKETDESKVSESTAIEDTTEGTSNDEEKETPVEGSSLPIWDGTSDVSWFDGEETEFHITTAEQLAGLVDLVNSGNTMKGKTFNIDNDLQLSDVSAVDASGHAHPKTQFKSMDKFEGTILGNDHKIIGFSCENHGLIQSAKGCTIKNLHLVDVYIWGKKSVCVGSFVGKAEESNIISCSAEGFIHFEDSPSAYIGGIAGVYYPDMGDEIKNCYSKVDIEIERKDINTIKHTCQVEVPDIAPGSRQKIEYTYYTMSQYIGGICARGFYIIGCVNDGNIKCLSDYDLKYTYYSSSGREADRQTKCEYNTNVGGICGETYGDIMCCENRGNISTNISYYGSFGGIFGNANPSIYVTNCKNSGNIESNTCWGYGIGCITGTNSLNAASIYDCYNVGNITGSHIYGVTNGNSKNVYNAGQLTSDREAYAIGGKPSNAYFLTGTADTGDENLISISKSQSNMMKEAFADSLSEYFYYKEGSYPVLGFEEGIPLSFLIRFETQTLHLKTDCISFERLNRQKDLYLVTTYTGDVEWISSDETVATVDNRGVVTSVGNGTAVIYALCGDTRVACSVSVGYDCYLNENQVTMKSGRNHQISVLDAKTNSAVKAGSVVWKSSDDSIASVDQNGNITAKKKGNAIITAQLSNITLECAVSVYEYQIPIKNDPVDEDVPRFSESEVTTPLNQSCKLVVLNYEDTITWVSPNKDIVKIDEEGNIIPVAKGESVVYAMLSNGCCLKAKVVIGDPVNIIGDVNSDGSFSVTDIVVFQKWLLGVPQVTMTNPENADFSEDGVLDIFDLGMMKRALLA